MGARRTPKKLKVRDYRRYCKLIDGALAALRELGLRSERRERVFSHRTLGNVNRLAFELKLRDSTEVETICRLILSIKKWLDEEFGDKTVEMRRWIKVQVIPFGKRDFRTLESILLSGERAQIGRAKTILQRTRM